MRPAVMVKLAAAASVLGWCLVAGAAPSSAAPASEEKSPGENGGVPPPGSSNQSGSGNLSKKLDKSEGVIAPPRGVDPQMQVEPPADASSGKMPVIPPPGSPGGNPNVMPK